MIGRGGRWGGRIWSFKWGLTPDSISELMHSELQTHPQWRGRGGKQLKEDETRAGWGLTPIFFTEMMQPTSHSSSLVAEAEAFGRRMKTNLKL